MKNIGKNIPRSVLTFYVHIYSKKRGITKFKDSSKVLIYNLELDPCTIYKFYFYLIVKCRLILPNMRFYLGEKQGNNRVLIEATRSWLSLNKNEKQKFVSKYEEYKNSYRKAIASQLKNAEPYLQKKTRKENNAINRKKTESFTNFNEETAGCNLNQSHSSMTQENGDTVNINSIMTTKESSLQYPTNNNNAVDVENQQTQILEPAPPKLMSGKELFIMINKNENLYWKKLPVVEKRRYNNAVLIIKKKYIKQYKTYLESLPSEKLYHYHKHLTK